jgi:hypothetical protein
MKSTQERRSNCSAEKKGNPFQPLRNVRLDKVGQEPLLDS